MNFRSASSEIQLYSTTVVHGELLTLNIFMVTVVNNPNPSERTVERVSDSSMGWAVAVIVLIAALVIGGYIWVRYRTTPSAAPASSGSTNINVTLPQTGAAPAENTGSGTGTGSANSY